MECGPTASDEVTNAAEPPLSVAVPRLVAPSRNWTVPVAVAGETVAVKVADCAYADGFGVALTVRLDAAFDTVCVRAVEELGSVFASPL
jgi:hypothetical protein